MGWAAQDGVSEGKRAVLLSLTPSEARHNMALAFTMQQGPVPTQHC